MLRYAHRRYASQKLKLRSAASSMMVVRSGRALDLCDVRQGGDVSPSPRCTAAPRHCRRDRRGRRRAGGWPKTRRLHRSLILGLAPLTSFVVSDGSPIPPERHESHRRIQHAPLLERPLRAQPWIAMCRSCHMCVQYVQRSSSQLQAVQIGVYMYTRALPLYWPGAC